MNLSQISLTQKNVIIARYSSKYWIQTPSRMSLLMIKKKCFFNKAYENFLNIPKEEAINKHVTRVIENTRLPIVCKNKVAEIDRLQGIHGRYAIAQRIPITNIVL